MIKLGECMITCKIYLTFIDLCFLTVCREFNNLTIVFFIKPTQSSLWKCGTMKLKTTTSTSQDLAWLPATLLKLYGRAALRWGVASLWAPKTASTGSMALVSTPHREMSSTTLVKTFFRNKNCFIESFKLKGFSNYEFWNIFLFN